MFDVFFVYMLQSTSRRALYIGFTKCLVSRVLEHRTRRHPSSFSAKYRTWRLVYYDEFGDYEAAFLRERQLKGWSRAKKEALITRMNPRWLLLNLRMGREYGLEFRIDGRITAKPGRSVIAVRPCEAQWLDHRVRQKPTPTTKQKILRLRYPALNCARVPPPLRMPDSCHRLQCGSLPRATPTTVSSKPTPQQPQGPSTRAFALAQGV